MSSEPKKTQPPLRTSTDNKAVLADAVARSTAPEWLKPYLKNVGPIFTKLGSLVDILSPFVTKAYLVGLQVWKKIEPYEPQDLVPMFFGLVLIFFGGYFVTTIACVEAFRIAGWDRFKKCMIQLYESYKDFKKKSDEDDTRDDDNDGIPDVQQIDSKELVTRKLKLFLISTSPANFQDALSGIYTGLVSVFATLRLQFARTITLGSTIGEMISPHAIKFLHPILGAIIPVDYHKWIDVVITYAARSVGVTIAWSLNRIVATVHSAMRGAQIFCDAFARYTAKRGYLHLSTGYWDEVFVGVCALFGFYFQIKSWFNLPWILYIPLFPFVVFERLLTYIVGLS